MSKSDTVLYRPRNYPTSVQGEDITPKRSLIELVQDVTSQFDNRTEYPLHLEESNYRPHSFNCDQNQDNFLSINSQDQLRQTH